MPKKSQRSLFQARLSDPDKRRIRALAVSQGLTLTEALLEAFAAWEEKLHAKAPAVPPTQAARPEAGGVSRLWLQQAAKLDWTKCPEVELMQSKDRRLWVLRGTMAPLAEVLQSMADGPPVEEVAEMFEVELNQLKKVLQYAGHSTKSESPLL
jgi:hypothetical protein